MFDKNAFVQTLQYEREATKWLQAIKRRENVSVVFFPKTDRLRRFQQFIEDAASIKKILGKKDRFFFQVLDLDPQDVEDKAGLYIRIAKLLNSAGITPH